MDWARAIERNSEALIEIVADLFDMLGLAGEAVVARLPWPTYRAVLRVLRPAESAMRRLVVIAARGLVVKLAPPRPMPVGPVKRKKGLPPRSFSFQLFDPRKRIVIPRQVITRRPAARLHIFTEDRGLVTLWPPPRPTASPAPAALPSADGLVNGARLVRRLEALESALADLPRQARRLVRRCGDWPPRACRVRPPWRRSGAPGSSCSRYDCHASVPTAVAPFRPASPMS